MKKILGVLVLSALMHSSFSEVSLTVNTNNRYQQIEGFEASVFYYRVWQVAHYLIGNE